MIRIRILQTLLYNCNILKVISLTLNQDIGATKFKIKVIKENTDPPKLSKEILTFFQISSIYPLMTSSIT